MVSMSLSSDGRTLLQKPLPELEKLRGTNHHFDNQNVAAGQTGFLPNIASRHLEIRAKIDSGTATRVGITVAKSADNTERTRIYWEVPNPANDLVNIAINVPFMAGKIVVNITDISGKIVDTLYFGTFAAGKTILELPTASIRNGLYFLTVFANGQIVGSGKMVK
jgi:hypothetical protein